MKKEKYRLTINDWSDGIWGNRTLFFKALHEAKERAKKENGKLKLYDENGHLIHSEERPKHTHHHHHHDHYA